MRENTASRTAIVVAKSQALVGSSRGTSELVDRDSLDFARAALVAAGQDRFVRSLRHPLFLRAVRFYESLMIPGLALHHVLRKKIIEQRVRNSLESGVKTVIHVGAGLDSLCFRLHRNWPEVSFLEFDHPATQRIKKTVIDTMGKAKNLFLKPLNLDDIEMPKIATARNRPPLLIIVEGVLMYLPPAVVTMWMNRWRVMSDQNSKLLFTFMDGPGFRNQPCLVDCWLRLAREPMRWYCDPVHIDSFLQEFGWDLRELLTTQRETTAQIASGEWIGEAAAISHQMKPGRSQ